MVAYPHGINAEEGHRVASLFCVDLYKCSVCILNVLRFVECTFAYAVVRVHIINV